MLTRRVHRLAGEETGFSVIELLVVTVLFSIVTGIAATAVITGLRTTRQAQERVHALAELERAAERLAKEVRVADDEGYPPANPGQLFTATDFEVVMDTYRNGQRVRFRFWRPTPVPGTPERLLETRQVLAPTLGGVGPTRVVVDDLANAATPVFAYLTADGGVPATPEEISQVRITLVRDLPEQDPITVQALVNLRNAES